MTTSTMSYSWLKQLSGRTISPGQSGWTTRLGGFRSAAYASGGIATRPTLGLVGEGKHNEAIVPLPDGKSIPVSMPGGAGQQNNVVVNVNIDSDGAVTQETEGQGVDLGTTIANVVQQELLNQKRQGGILNPNGVA